MMATVRIHFSGPAPQIGPDHKDSLCPMSTESMFRMANNQRNWFIIRFNNCSDDFFFCRTNILDRYFNKDFTLKLPDNKKITEIKWLAIYDLSTQNDFGDVYIPEAFEPPRSQRGSSFSKQSHGVNSGPVEVLDSKMIRIPELYYDGTGSKTYFLVGVGAQPSSKGTKVPDELG